VEFVLEVRPPKGERFYVPLPASGTLTVGREAPADLVIQDQFLSRSHFQVVCENMIHILIDPGSSNGTYLNGVRLRQAVLKPRDAIFAGRTAIRIGAAMEGKILLDTLPESPGELLPWQSKLIDTIESTCNLAVLDGAVSPAVRDLLNQAGVFYQSLYEGERSADIAAFGPYLAEIQKGSKFVPFLVKAAWGRSWGIFLSTRLSFLEARKHLRRFLTVNIEGGGMVLFRYYDPRVLRVFIPSCTLEQRRDFFGPIERIFAESDTKTVAFSFSADAETRLQFEIDPPAGS
jgi:hypothetical protein